MSVDKDLALLAAGRVSKAVNSVLQLLDEPHQRISLILFIMAALGKEASTMLHDEATKLEPHVEEMSSRVFLMVKLGELLEIPMEGASLDIIEKVKKELGRDD